MSEKVWQKAAQAVVKASMDPLLQANETIVELLKTLLNEDEAIFISNFRKPILSIERLKEKSGMDVLSIKQMLNSIMRKGVIMDIPHKNTGEMVYQLLAPLPYLWEYSIIRKCSEEQKKNLAQIHETMMKEAVERTQKNYEGMVPLLRSQFPPLTRTIPIEKDLGIPLEETIPLSKASKLLEKQEIISLSECPCKLDKSLIEEPCNTTDERYRCFHFGNTGRFFIEHGFGESVSIEKAKEILSAAEKDGLVHKVFHYSFDPKDEEEALCNCCKCCCIVFQSFYRGIWPFHTITSYIARVDNNKCKGCGTCLEKCPIEAISLTNGKSYIDDTRCIGCGFCTYHCPENARDLEKIELRNVYIPPPKKE
ncbi:MAG: ATP-binding protein [Promethearchaeota archaeon]|jgi:ferredoxin